jgi:predicted TIM-barrel fold metal-dependent hydrolase
MAQIFLNDIPAAVEEIRWAREQNLFGGILLPGVPPDSGLPPLIAPDYEPIWQVCEELDMPINNHSGQSGPDFGNYPASMAIWMIELGWFSHRVFWHMVFGGAFGRHPGLKLVLTEQSAGWVPGALALLDHHYERFLTPGAAEAHFGGAIAAEMKMSPSECWNQNCYAGASFFRPSECKVRYKIGVDRIMWGQDYPHGEGTYPYTREALQNTFAGVPTDEVALMVGGNAAAVYGFDLDALAPVAERVGPTIEQTFQPLDAIPADTLSMAFADQELKPW